MCKFVAKYREMIIYLVFGVLTTIVNFIIYFPLLYFLQLPATASNIIAWCISVLFAFFTNKVFVFSSKNWSIKTALPEFFAFISCRLLSVFLESAILFISIDLLEGNGVIWKVIASVFVIIINYLASKLMIFKRK